MPRLILVLAIVALTVYAAADCGQSRATQRGGVPRGLWLVLIIVIPVLGPILWLVVSRRAGGGATRQSPAGRSPAPDDDPDFLWKLERDRRRGDGGTVDGGDQHKDH